MWRCQLLRVFSALLILLAGAAFPSFVPAATSRLNFVVIVVDDLGWADLACYGSTYHQTPHIDRLASEGIRFTHSYAAAAICSPTRAAYMTGRYPVRTGITDWIRARFQGGKIPADRKKNLGWEGGPKQKLLTPVNPLWMGLEKITIPELLKTAGYSTCHIGKWHLGTDDWYPEKQGYDVNIGGCDLGEPPAYFDPYCRAPNLVEPGEEPLFGIPTLSPRLRDEYLTDREADEAVHFIKTHKDQPFFLSLCHHAVHAPIQAKKKLIDKYSAITLSEKNNLAATMPAKSRELNAALEEWLNKTGAKIPRPNPEFSSGN